MRVVGLLTAVLASSLEDGSLSDEADSPGRTLLDFFIIESRLKLSSAHNQYHVLKSGCGYNFFAN